MLYSKRTDVRSRLKHQIKWRGLALLIVLLILSGCGGGSSGSNNQATSTVSPTNARFAGLAKETHFKTLRTLRVSNSAITATSTAAPAGPTPFTATGSFTLPVQDFSFQVSELFGTILFHYGFPSSQDPALLPLPQSFASTALIPTVSADEQFATNSMVDGGITLTLRNDQNQDSYTFAGPPSGSNVTYLSNDTVVNADGTTTWDWFASITFASGWTVVVGQDVFFDPGTGFGGFEQFSRQMWFIRPNLPQITVDNPTVVHGDSVQNTTTLNFQISTSNNTLNAWSVAAVQNGTTLKSFAPTADTRGPGVTNGSNPLNVSLTWDGVDSSNNRVAGDFNWVVTANTTNFVAGGPVNDGVNSTQVVVADATASVSIENATATPANFAAGEKSTLSFDINVKGLVQPTTYWLVSIKDSSNTTVLNRSVLAKSLQANSIIINPPPNPFFVFEPGTNTDGRTAVHVVVPWDGKGTNNTIISGPFTWVIDAQATSASMPTPVSATEVAVDSDPATLKVFSNNTLIAITSDSAPYLETINSVRLQRLATVYSDQGAWVLDVNNVKFNGPLGSQPLQATFRPTVSLTDIPPMNMTLVDLTQGKFKATFTLPPDFIKRDVAKLRKPTSSTFYQSKLSKKERDAGGSTAEDLPQIFKDIALQRYPHPVTFLGESLELAQSEIVTSASGNVSKVTDPEFTDASKNNFLAGGFEAVEVTLSHPNLKNKLTAVVKVKHPASLVVCEHHGDHDGTIHPISPVTGLLPTQTPEVLNNSTKPGPGLNAETRTLVITSCQALDLNDYNNFFVSANVNEDTVFGNGPHDPQAGLDVRKKFGGRLWWNNTRKPAPPGSGATIGDNEGTVLLGYCAPATKFSTIAFTKYADYLGNGTAPALAWVRANRDQGDGTTTGGPVQLWAALNACAYDDQNYYFIFYDPPPFKDLPPLVPTSNKVQAKGIYRISRQSWDKPREDGWLAPPDDVGQKL